MKVNRTFIHLQNFDVIASAYNAKNNGIDNLLTSAIHKFSKQLKVVYEEYNDQRDDLQLTHCLKDEKRQQAIMKDDQDRRMYSEAGERALKIALKELGKKEWELHSRIPEGVEALVPQLTEIEKEYFSELIIPKQPETE